MDPCSTREILLPFCASSQEGWFHKRRHRQLQLRSEEQRKKKLSKQRTPKANRQQIKSPKRQKGEHLRLRPRIFAPNAPIYAASSTSLRSMHAVGTGARLSLHPLYLVLVPHSFATRFLEVPKKVRALCPEPRTLAFLWTGMDPGNLVPERVDHCRPRRLATSLISDSVPMGSRRWDSD